MGERINGNDGLVDDVRAEGFVSIGETRGLIQALMGELALLGDQLGVETLDPRIIVARSQLAVQLQGLLEKSVVFRASLSGGQVVESTETQEACSLNPVLSTVRELVHNIGSKDTFAELCFYLDEIWGSLDPSQRIVVLDCVTSHLGQNQELLDEYLEPPERLWNLLLQRGELPSFALLFRKVRLYKDAKSIIGAKNGVDVFAILKSPYLKNVKDICFDFPIKSERAKRVEENVGHINLKCLDLTRAGSLSKPTLKRLLKMSCCNQLEELRLSCIFDDYSDVLREFNLENLRVLKIDNINCVIRHIDRLGGLKELDLSDSSFGDEGFYRFLAVAKDKLPNLEILNISRSRCSANCLLALLKCDGLSGVKDFSCDRSVNPDGSLTAFGSTYRGRFSDFPLTDQERLREVLNESNYHFRSLSLGFQAMSNACFHSLCASEVLDDAKSLKLTLTDTQVQVLQTKKMSFLEELRLVTMNDGLCPVLRGLNLSNLICSDFFGGLKVLDLSGQSIVYIVVVNLANRFGMNLEKLYLNNCSMSDGFFNILFGLVDKADLDVEGLNTSKLEVLSLRRNGLSADVCRLLLVEPKFKNLEVLDLRDNLDRRVDRRPDRIAIPESGHDEGSRDLRILRIGSGSVGNNVFNGAEIGSLLNLPFGRYFHLLDLGCVTPNVRRLFNGRGLEGVELRIA